MSVVELWWNHNMMRFTISRVAKPVRLLVLICVATILQSCVGFENLPKPITVGQMMQAIRCELSAGLNDVRRDHSWLLNWSGGVRLNTSTYRTEGPSIGGSVLLPSLPRINSTYVYFNEPKSSNSSQTVNASLGQLRGELRNDCPVVVAGGIFDASALGIRGWIVDMATQIDQAGMASSTKALRFTVSFNVSEGGLINVYLSNGLDVGYNKYGYANQSLSIALAPRASDIDLSVDMQAY